MNANYIIQQPIHSAPRTPLGLTKSILGIAGLSSAPTFDWSTQAAKALAPLHPQAMIGVVIARHDHTRNRLSVESSGVLQNPSIQSPPSGGQLRSSLERLVASPLSKDATPNKAGLVAPIAHVFPYASTSKAQSVWTDPAAPNQCLIACAALPGTDNQTNDTSLAILIAIATESPAHPTIDPVSLSMALAAMTMKAAGAITPDNAGKIHWLTQREQIILDHLIIGMSVRQIAESIDRSPHTVHDHVKNLHRKLGASCRGQLITRALGHQDASEPIELIDPVIDPILVPIHTTTDPHHSGGIAEPKALSNQTTYPKARPLKTQPAA